MNSVVQHCKQAVALQAVALQAVALHVGPIFSFAPDPELKQCSGFPAY